MMPHYYNYELMKHINGDTQMTDVWRLPAIAPWEKSCSKHPTQKPLGLLSRIILASTKPGAWILDPFAGSSTTGIAANLLERRFLGIEREEIFAAISKARREEIENVQTFATYRRKIPDIVKAENNQLELSMCCESEGIESLPFLSDESPKKHVLMYADISHSRKSVRTEFSKKMRQKHANHGTKWSLEEEKRLWALFIEKKTIEELAWIFDRSKRAIELRLHKIEQEKKPLTK